MQQMTIANDITVTISKHKRAKYLKVWVDQRGNVKATIPYFIPYWTGKLFIKERESWIIRQLESIKDQIQPQEVPLKQKKEKFAQARQFVTEKVKLFASIYNVKYSRISIKDQKTVWGSCSQKGNLNFSWRIIQLPERVADYLIVHELCHLREMNHSKRFWKLVEQTIPEYKIHRKWLKQHSMNIY